MRRGRLGLILGLLVIGPPLLAFGLDVPLKYRTHADRKEGEFLPSGYARIQKSFECPAGDFKLPKLTSDQPIYGILEIGDQRRLLILDRTEASDEFYTRIYFDSNGNRDLTDDSILDGTPEISEERDWFTAEFPPVDTTVRVGDHDLPYRFECNCYFFSREKKPKLSNQDLEEHLRLYYSVICFYSGEFTLDGERYSVMVCDRNGDGRFDMKTSVPSLDEMHPRWPIYAGGDSLYLTTGTKATYWDRRPLGDWISLDGKLFEVKVSMVEKKMTLASFTGELHSLTLGMETSRMGLVTEDGKSCLNLFRPGKSARIPEGSYRLLDYEVLRKDDQGDLWRLHASGTKESPVIVAGPRQISVFRFGEPYRPMAQVHPRFLEELKKSGDKVRIMLMVLGAAQETVDDIRHLEGNRTRLERSKEDPYRPREPSYEILNSDGKVIGRGDFEYG